MFSMLDAVDTTVTGKSNPFNKRPTQVAASVTATENPFNPLGSATSIQVVSHAAGLHPGSNRTQAGSYLEKPPDQVGRMFY